MKICFLTAIISSKGYNTDIPGNFKPFNNYDFFYLLIYRRKIYNKNADGIL